MDEQPVVVVPATDATSASVFPQREVAKFNVDRGHAVARRVIHAVLFLGLTFAFASLSTFRESPRLAALGLPGHEGFTTAVLFILVILLLVLIAVDFSTVLTWEMYALCALLAFVFLILIGEALAAIVVVPALIGAPAYGIRRSRMARRSKWRRLAPILSDHWLLEVEVVRHGWYASRGGGSTSHSLLLVLASSQFPGRQWQAILTLHGPELQFAPETGDRMLIFVCPADLDVAVVRPIYPA